MRRCVSILIAASLAAGAGYSPAYAGMSAPPAFAASSGHLILVDRDGKKKKKPKKKHSSRDRRDDSRDHRNYSRSRDRHRDWDDHDHGDAAAAFALGVIGGLATGAIVGSSRSYGGSSLAGACAQRYRSFDPRTGTYMGYDGYRHPCRL